jgi:Fe-S cluster assembly protein SufD
MSTPQGAGFSEESGFLAETGLSSLPVEEMTATGPLQVPGGTGKSRIRLSVPAGAHALAVQVLDASDTEQAHVLQIEVGEGGELEYVLFQDAPAAAQVRLWQQAKLGKDAVIRWVVASVGGADIRHAVRSELQGEGAVSDVSVLCYARGTEKAAITVRNVFLAGHGGGEITMRAVGEDKAHLRLDGLIEIGLRGGGTDTYLTQEVLMLDPTARVDAVPGLEIKTNDVKASHSATVTRVTPEDLFYFGSRGIQEREARKMFVEGFLADLTQRILDEALRERVTEAISRKYGE